ncbi:MAG: lipid-A-disaccharide synthase [Candidatus Omnitrophica bacterium]|nr:lipid-A-disaccharide synthase [Candidatus Omnitrophota bacterium]
MKKIMLLAGEPSGDLHGSNLASELKKASSQVELLGTGGEKMKHAGVKLFFDLKDLAMTGFLDVIKNYSRLKNIQSTLLSKIKEENINLIILIDYPGFNLRFAQRAQKEGVPIIYYISPQVWAWRKHRIKLIKKYVKKIIVIFKFEETLYKNAGVPVEFVGHPLLDIVKSDITKENFLKGLRLEAHDKIIALLPGSRKRLVKTLLPIMLKSSKLIYKKFPKARFLISKPSSIDMEVYEKILKGSDLPITIIESKTYEIINSSDLVLVVSGTSTLETAILGKPMVIVFKLALLEYIVGRPLLRVKNIGLVNIVAGREVVPELIQFKVRPSKIAQIAIDILSNPSRYESMKKEIASVKNRLYPDGASRKAALAVLKFLQT